MLSVRIDEDLSLELAILAENTNRTKSFYLIEAIEDHLCDYKMAIEAELDDDDEDES